MVEVKSYRCDWCNIEISSNDRNYVSIGKHNGVPYGDIMMDGDVCSGCIHRIKVLKSTTWNGKR